MHHAPAAVSPAADPAAAAIRAPRALVGLLLLSCTIIVGRIAHGVFGPLQELAKNDLQLSDFEVSLVQGLAASIPVAVLSIPLGRMVDRTNRVRLLLAMTLTWTIGTLLTAVVEQFSLLFLARTLAGIGMMCSLPVAISIAADLSPPDRRGRALLVLSIGMMVGAAAAFVLGGWLLGLIGKNPAAWFGGMAPWRSVHLVIGIASALWLLPLLLMREPARHELGDVIDPGFREALSAIWARRKLLAPLFIGQTSVVMADASAGIWAAPVLIRDYGQSPEQFGPWMGLVVVLSGLIGSVIGALAADLGQKNRIPGGMLGVAVVAALCSVPAACFPLMPSATGFALALFALLVCGSITGLITSTAIAVLVPNEIRGICLGAFIVVGSLFGIGMAPTLVTLFSDALGGEAHVRQGLALLVLLGSLLSAGGFIHALRGKRRAPQVSLAEAA